MKNIPIMRVSLVRDGAVKADSKMADCPKLVAELVYSYLGPVDREHFVCVFLSARQSVIGINTVSMGTISASLVHPRETFKGAILANAAAVVIAHNHPSGDITPSAEDKDATRRLVRAGELLGIPVVDHVIIGPDAGYYFSFKESGIL